MRVEDDASIYIRESVREKRELVYRKDKCIGCWLCYESCPTEAITRNPIGMVEDRREGHANIVIDPEKCILCGVCTEVCLFGSIDLRIDGTSIVELNYPKFRGRWELDQEKCKPKDAENLLLCDDCEKACPREAIKCSLDVKNGKKIKNVVARDEKLCIYCTSCNIACPEDAISVEKVLEGEISVDLEKCQGCGVCVDICPSQALEMPQGDIGERTDRLVINQDVCIYCGACANSCPVEALTVKKKGLKYSKEKERSATKRRERIFQELITEE